MPLRSIIEPLSSICLPWNESWSRLTRAFESQHRWRASKQVLSLVIGVVERSMAINSWKVNLPTSSKNYQIGHFRLAIIQLIAASQAGRALVYLTFRDQLLVTSFYDVYQYLVDEKATVKDLCHYLQKYSTVHKRYALFDFILQTPVASLY